MDRTGEDFRRLATRRSSWVLPLGVFFITACLSAIVFAYYFAPGTPGLGAELPAPTDATRPVALTVGDSRFRVPANYILLASSRRGGPLAELAMAATLPDFQGYSFATAEEYVGNTADSSVIYFSIRSGQIPFPEEERLDRIYLTNVVDAAGEAGPYGLKQFAFRPESGYRAQQLFVGTTNAGTVVLLCDRQSADVQSPNCMRDLPLGQALALSYRFKRAHLDQWRAIDSGLKALLNGFVDRN